MERERKKAKMCNTYVCPVCTRCTHYTHVFMVYACYNNN